MKKLFYRISVLLLSVCFVLTGSPTVSAQDSVVNLNKEEVSSWFSQNWIWVVGGVIFLLIIIIAASGRKKSTRTSTTIVKDEQGNTKRVTTTEVTE